MLIENKLNSTLPETLGNLVQLEDLAIDDNVSFLINFLGPFLD